jgi:hypothetical protein
MLQCILHGQLAFVTSALISMCQMIASVELSPRYVMLHAILSFCVASWQFFINSVEKCVPDDCFSSAFTQVRHAICWCE